jgi:aldehyde dehydrogenase (NAD+)
MTSILDRITGSASTKTFDSLNPSNGDVVGTYPIHTAEEVDAAVTRARGEVAWWQGLGFEDRQDLLLQWKGVITRRMAQLAEVVHRETGKPHGDAQLEIALAIDHLDWAAKHAKKVLGRHKVPSGLLMANQASSVAYHPLGVVGIIGPWNYPVFTPMGSIVYALAAGNPVVFKPSEYTPGVGTWLADTFSEVVHGRPVFQVVTGLGETGNALCLADVDKLAFTGSAATGKKVMAACATNLTPVIIEAGGKDSMIVDEDADVSAAAEATLWGGFSNAGQTCVGIERVYVHEKVFDRFMSEITALAQSVRPGFEDGGNIGPITMPSQIDIIKGHLDDAVAKGATVVLGGPDGVGERYVQPTILTHVPEDSTEITHETFGPTLAVNPVTSMDEAVELTNATKNSLAGAVFAKKNGMAIAERVRSGMTSINSVIAFAAVPSLPFGGVGESGFGRIHGPDGLKEFTYAKAITRQRFKPLLALTSFARDAKTDARAAKLISIMHGGKGTLPKR